MQALSPLFAPAGDWSFGAHLWSIGVELSEVADWVAPGTTVNVATARLAWLRIDAAYMSEVVAANVERGDSYPLAGTSSPCDMED